MFTAIILVILLFVPGLLLIIALGVPIRNTLSALAVSYAIFIANSHFSSFIGIPVAVIWLYGLESFFLILWVVIKGIVKNHGNSLRHYPPFDFWGPYLLIIIVTGLYMLFVGPYLEIPADVWRHLALIDGYSNKVDSGNLDLNQLWYLAYSVVLTITGESLDRTLETYSFLGTIIFTILIYDVSRLLYLQKFNNARKATIFGIASTALTFLMFGSSVFAFVRYYVFAPVFLCYPIFLFSVYVLHSVEFCGDSVRRNASAIGLFLLCLVVTYLVHRQETLFICIYAVAYGIYLSFYRLRNTIKSYTSKGRIRTGYVFVLAAVSFILVAWILFEITRGASLSDHIPLGNNTVSLSPIEGISWFVADPAGRVFETIGLWGLIVLIVYFAVLRKGDRITALSILAVVPFLLLFNPLFTNLFLPRAGHDVLWRLAYMVPVGLLGANVIVHSLSKLKKGKWSHIFVLLLLIVTLIPIPQLQRIQNTRWTTLKSVPIGNSYEIWTDLIVELRRYQNRNILTDPITGYVVKTLTENKVFGFKFHDGPPFIPINYSGYGPTSFKGYQTWLFIENHRDGAKSKNGEISGHWSQDIMKVSSRYSPDLRYFLKTPPPHFRLIWEREGIRVFEIASN